MQKRPSNRWASFFGFLEFGPKRTAVLQINNVCSYRSTDHQYWKSSSAGVFGIFIENVLRKKAPQKPQMNQYSKSALLMP